MRRLPSGRLQSQQQQLLPTDENATPFQPSSGLAISASPASSVRVMGSPSKLPTLSDIAARLNRDKDFVTPTTSPIKQQRPFSSGGSEAGRPRLELTGRITGSPKPLQYDDRKSPLLSLSPLKSSSTVARFDDPSSACASPVVPSSGASSPTKRMLAHGLPSLEEIRDRMSRKGLAGSSEGSSPRPPSVPSSPSKLAAQAELFTSPEVIEATPTGLVTPSTKDEHKEAATVKASSIPAKPILRVSTSTSSSLTPKLKHPLPPSPARPPSYPLQHEWTLFFDTRSAGPSTPGLTPSLDSPHLPLTPTLSTSSWEANLRTIGSYFAVETFLPCFSKLRRPSQLDRHSSYHVFKDGIKPMWEDPRNAKGGKWTITFRLRNPALVDRSWLWLVLGLIGEEMDGEDEACGAVCSVKPRGDRIALWVKDRSDVEKVNRIGRKLISLLELEKEPGISMEFSAHSDRADEAKLEGVYSVQNPMQASLGSAKLPGYSSPSPDTRSPATTAEPYTRLNGQRTPAAGVFARSPPSTSSPFGALGQSLGLGIAGVGATSPTAGVAPQGKMGAFSWRASTSPRSRGASPRRRDAAEEGGEAAGMRSKSTSPFKAP